MNEQCKMNRKISRTNGIPSNIQQSIEEIRLDNTSGSAELAVKAAQTLIDLVTTNKISSASQLRKSITKTAKNLVNAQPAMAPLFNIANETLHAVDELNDKERIQASTKETCERFIKSIQSVNQEISNHLQHLIPDEIIILTHSYSSTVLNVLLQAKKQGRKFQVICTESRPMNEGIKLAEKLGKNGIKTKLVVDAAMFSFLDQVDVVIVGSDAIMKTGVVNKIGTFGLMVSAREMSVKCYTLASSDKILPEKHQVTLANEKEPTEILSKPWPKNVIPLNHYFEITPLKFFTGVISEKGIISPNETMQYMKKKRVHPALM